MCRIQWNLFGKIWIQNVGDIDVEVISATENSNKFQKTRFWKENAVEDVVTGGVTAQATLVTIMFESKKLKKIQAHETKRVRAYVQEITNERQIIWRNTYLKAFFRKSLFIFIF